MLAEPEDKAWHLCEFRVAGLDGNQLRVFYDLSSECKRSSDLYRPHLRPKSIAQVRLGFVDATDKRGP